jgi:hypothetical protein
VTSFGYESTVNCQMESARGSHVKEMEFRSSCEHDEVMSRMEALSVRTIPVIAQLMPGDAQATGQQGPVDCRTVG